MLEIVPNPLGSHYRYLVNIALPNCSDDFFPALRLRGERHENGQGELKLLRYFVNAAESLNNALEYFYWENFEADRHVNDAEFLKKAKREYPIFEKLADIANVYKHAQRNGKKTENKPLRKATQLVDSGWFQTSWDEEGPSGKIYHPSVKDDWISTIEEAFQFWIRFVNDDPSAECVRESLLGMMLK